MSGRMAEAVWCESTDMWCTFCSSAHMEDITHLHSLQHSKGQRDRCTADGLCQVSSMPQGPRLSSLARNGEASVRSSSMSKVAVLPLLADATASSVTLAEAAFQESVALPQSKQECSKAEQHGPSNQWAREVIKVIYLQRPLMTPVPSN